MANGNGDKGGEGGDEMRGRKKKGKRRWRW